MEVKMAILENRGGMEEFIKKVVEYIKNLRFPNGLNFFLKQKDLLFLMCLHPAKRMFFL